MKHGPQPLNLVGESFGKLTVLRLARTLPRAWRCQCACGKIKTIQQRHLRDGNTKSCGCICTTHGDAAKGGTKEYHAWQDMKQRCFNPRDAKFSDYGGRGITVCKRWRTSFAAFLKDMTRAPGLNYSIDRINNNGNYTPKNCRWATAKTQRNNQRCSA